MSNREVYGAQPPSAAGDTLEVGDNAIAPEFLNAIHLHCKNETERQQQSCCLPAPSCYSLACLLPVLFSFFVVVFVVVLVSTHWRRINDDDSIGWIFKIGRAHV